AFMVITRIDSRHMARRWQHRRSGFSCSNLEPRSVDGSIAAHDFANGGIGSAEISCTRGCIDKNDSIASRLTLSDGGCKDRPPCVRPYAWVRRVRQCKHGYRCDVCKRGKAAALRRFRFGIADEFGCRNTPFGAASNARDIGFSAAVLEE